MAIFNIPNIVIAGVSACVPRTIERNRDSALLDEDEKEKLIASIGVEEKRVADDRTATSDLCFEAAEQLIADLEWNKADIEVLIFVSQTPDYILPATSCILQERLGLSQECYAVDISLGCSGWVYGLSTIASIMSAGQLHKGLLLVGDTAMKLGSSLDKSYFPLFGDAGTVTALEYEAGNRGMTFHTATDGSGKEAILIPEGGYRIPFNTSTLRLQNVGGGKPAERRALPIGRNGYFLICHNESSQKYQESTGACRSGERGHRLLFDASGQFVFERDHSPKAQTHRSASPVFDPQIRQYEQCFDPAHYGHRDKGGLAKSSTETDRMRIRRRFVVGHRLFRDRFDCMSGFIRIPNS